MSQIRNVIESMNDLLQKQDQMFETQQRIHFDWLSMINFQMEMFGENSFKQSNIEPPQKAFESYDSDDNSEKEVIEIDVSQKMHVSNNSTVRFVDDDCLLEDSDESDSDNNNESNNHTHISLQEFSENASLFKEKWDAIVNEKKSPLRQSPVHKEKIQEYEEVCNYMMSEDSEDNDDDESMYERNPIEIHGKTIPFWARDKALERQLKKQYKIDADLIFPHFDSYVPMEDIFACSKQRYNNRTDSGYWDSDRVTPEEVFAFKKAIGIA